MLIAGTIIAADTQLCKVVGS